MDNSAYISLTRQLALFRDIEVTAGNIANANTQGYNAEHILFNSYLSADTGPDDQMAFPNPASTYRDTTNGSLTSTGNALDVALSGPGYFTVQTPLGVRYTRAGSFKTDGDGNLTTPDGYPVLDNNGQLIQLPDNTRDIKIGSAGNLQINGSELTTIGVVQFSNPQLLEAAGHGLFKSDAQPNADLDGVEVVQGAFESSNVQPVTELTHMMSLTQDVTNNAKFIEVIYDLERKTSDAWAQQSS